MKAKSSETVEEVMARISQGDILYHYFNITTLPALISSPLRRDLHPSFSIYSPDGEKVRYIDYATGERGDIYTLMQQYFHLSFSEVIRKISVEVKGSGSVSAFNPTPSLGDKKFLRHDTDIKVKVRDWEEHDIEYWKSYGISLPWLKYAEVYPISHKIIYKDGNRYVFPAAKYAYCFVERKEGKVTLKVYQPKVVNRRDKWINKNDGSVVGLWTKVPKTGDKLVICSSLKDALCLWSNTRIPCIYVQSECTGMSETAINVLKSRFKHIYVCFDNDEQGLHGGKVFSAQTGFQNVVLPSFDGGKDISDLYHVKGKEEFIKTVKPLFNV